MKCALFILSIFAAAAIAAPQHYDPWSNDFFASDPESRHHGAPPATQAPPLAPQVQRPVEESHLSTGHFATAQPSEVPVEGTESEETIHYHADVGGVQKGSGGGDTNVHVYTDENGKKQFSDELDPETEKYIREHMLPKLGGKKRKGSGEGVWSVFGQ